ncbi:hypothetical protein GCM10028774_41270 [Spirosoma jeollabukense]
MGMKEIKEGSRVSVSVYQGDIYLRLYKGTVTGFTESGLFKVEPDRYKGIKCVSATNVQVVANPA